MTTVDQRRTFETMVPDTPAGRAAVWVMRHTVERGANVTEEEVLTHLDAGSLRDDFDFEEHREGYGWVADQLGDGFTVTAVDGTDPSEVTALISSQSGRRWEWIVTVAPEAPHGITRAWLQRALPPGVEIRAARPEDGPALSEVARRAPIRLNDASITIDPGADYLAACRLMGTTAVTYVATHEGRPIGIHCGVSYPARLDGVERRFCLVAHSRLLPEFTGGGIWGRLNDTVFSHFDFDGGVDVGIAYVRPDNAAAQRLGGTESRWPTRVFRAVLDCGAIAGPAAGRPSSSADTSRVLTLLNDFHRDEEFFFPHTEATLRERLTRAAEVYTWDNVWLGERAVVGCWASGETHTLVPEHGEPIVSRRAVVVDYGFEPGAEDDFEALLRAWCARLAASGVTHLGVFSSPASPGAARLRALAATVEEYDVMPAGVPETPAATRAGIYVDPVYF